MKKLTKKIENLQIKKLTHKHVSAFTLMEMLLALAIIAILIGAIIVAINPGRQMAQSRNVQRDSDLHALQYAIQQYYLENREYPEGLDDTLRDICREGIVDDNCVDLSSYLVPKYITAMPEDPQASASSTLYQMAINSNSGTIELTAPNSLEYGMKPIQIGTKNLARYILGNALSFDGVGDYVLIPHDASLNFSEITISAWINTKDLAGDEGIFSKNNATGYFLRKRQGSLFLAVGGAWNNIFSPPVLVANKWTHIVFYYSGTNGEIFVDGVSVANGSSGLINAGTSDFFIGARNGTSEFFNGLIDDVTIFNRVLSQVEIEHLYNSGKGIYADTSIPPFNNGLIAGYNFDEDSGTIAKDIMGNNNGTIIGATHEEGVIYVPVD